MTEYHVMNNKRYCLTNDSANNVQLWELDTLKCVHKFNQPFANAKKLLSDNYDIVHSKEKPLPQSWMSVDINLGVSILLTKTF